MTNPNQKSGRIQRVLVVVLALGLTIMLGTALVKRLQSPSLTEQRPQAPQMQQQQQGGGEEAGESDMVGALMQQVAKNPNDMDALIHLAEALMHAENWQAAETFAQRASVLDLNNPQPLFMLGVILHNLGRDNEAAQALEKVIPLRDDARVRYSLGVLYLYYLEQKDKGLACLEAGLKDPAIDAELKQAINEELEKHRPASKAAPK